MNKIKYVLQNKLHNILRQVSLIIIVIGGFFFAIISHANNLDVTKKPVMVWFVVHSVNGNESKNEIVSALSENPNLMHLAKVLHEKASARGLSIVLPYWDLQDMSAISADDLWKMKVKDLDKLQKASERYHSPDILLIKMNAEKKEQTESTKACVSEWMFVVESQKKIMPWKESAVNCDAGIQEGMVRAVDVLKGTSEQKKSEVDSTSVVSFTDLSKKDMSQKEKSVSANDLKPADAPKKTMPETLLIHVSISNIQSAQDYQQVLDDLQKQPKVLDVQIEKVAPSQVLYAININGDLTGFINDMKNSSNTRQIPLQLLQEDSLENKVEYLLIKENMQ